MAPAQTTSRHGRYGIWPSAALLVLAALGVALALQTLLSDYALAGTLLSADAWRRVAEWLGGRPPLASGGSLVEDLPLSALLLLSSLTAATCWLGGAALLTWKTKTSFGANLVVWARRGSVWWLIPGVWWLLWTISVIAGWNAPAVFLAATPPLWCAVPLAGFAASFFALAARDEKETGSLAAAGRGIPSAVWLAMALYVVIFTTMNWQLYRGLHLPHGDSAMYEEHLWNLEHGRGFRSDLDPGLFLGEHIQVIHVALVPLHLLWPSHLLLELCESLALAAGAIPVFLIARRHTGSAQAGTLLACAYLLYFPLQFLDIAIDLKTFRPIAFGVPLLLFAIDRMERGKFVSMAVLLLCALSAKEDYSIVIAPLGLWLLLRGGTASPVAAASSRRHPRGETDLAVAEAGTLQPGEDDRSPIRRARRVGAAMMLLSSGYLVLVLLVLIPAFRAGHAPHYTGYFGWLRDLAQTPGEIGDAAAGPLAIVRAMFAHPAAWLGRLFSLKSLLSLLLLLLPIGCLSCLSPGRLTVALPLFAVLCLMETSGGAPQNTGLPLVPYHHFHAPLIPILFWAAAAGLARAPAIGIKLRHWRVAGAGPQGSPGDAGSTGDSQSLQPRPPETRGTAAVWARHFAWTSAAACGLFFSLSPLGVLFWDAGSQWHWSRLYVPGERAAQFPAVFAMIPPDARVASTDLLHPRFTHHARSYDYSQYPRAVNDNKPGAPPDTDYIVIDKQGRYSQIKRPGEIREFRERPADWEVLLDSDYFIVLKRRTR